MKSINFSIVIPTFNRSVLVEQLLASLDCERGNYAYGRSEVIVVDSSKGDEKANIMASCGVYGFKYLESGDSVRAKRNLGIDAARNDYVLFLDSDVIAEKGLLNVHAQAWLSFAEKDKIGGTFGLTKFVGARTKLWKIIELSGFVDSFGFAKKMPNVSWAIGNNVSFKKDVLIEVGKFKTDLPFNLGGDDLEMSYRVTKAGYIIKCVPDAIVFHSRETWNSCNAINDRLKRWGTIEYHILKLHPELVCARLMDSFEIAMFYGIVCLMFSMCFSQSFPIVFLVSVCVISFFSEFFQFVSENGPANIFYWAGAKILERNYRFHRFIASIKHKDASLCFKTIFFSTKHIKNEFKMRIRKPWIHVGVVAVSFFVMFAYMKVCGII